MKFRPKVKVTPAMARKWLTCNRDNNRRPKTAKVTAYARDMRAGRWLLTGEPIKFDTDGFLMDGQNRLLAVIEADVPVEFSVMEGLDPAAMLVMDSGASRSFADALAIGYGAHDKFEVSSIVRWVMATELGLWRGTGGGYNPTHAELAGRYELDADLFGVAAGWSRDVYAAGLGVPSAAGTAYFLFAGIDPDRVKPWFDSLVSGANLDPGDPVLTLRNRLTRAKFDNLHRIQQLALFVRAWNATREGRSMAKLGVVPVQKLTNDTFPRPA